MSKCNFRNSIIWSIFLIGNFLRKNLTITIRGSIDDNFVRYEKKKLKYNKLLLLILYT